MTSSPPAAQAEIAEQKWLALFSTRDGSLMEVARFDSERDKVFGHQWFATGAAFAGYVYPAPLSTASPAQAEPAASAGERDGPEVGPDTWINIRVRPGFGALMDALGLADGLRKLPESVREKWHYWGGWSMSDESSRAAVPVEQQQAGEPVAWERIAWVLAEQAGDDPGHLIWEGNPPEPWGEVWLRYETQAREIAALFAAPAQPQPAVEQQAVEAGAVAWAVYWGVENKQMHWPPFKTKDAANICASEIKSVTEVRPLYTRPAAQQVRALTEAAGSPLDMLLQDIDYAIIHGWPSKSLTRIARKRERMWAGSAPAGIPGQAEDDAPEPDDWRDPNPDGYHPLA